MIVFLYFASGSPFPMAVFWFMGETKRSKMISAVLYIVDNRRRHWHHIRFLSCFYFSFIKIYYFFSKKFREQTRNKCHEKCEKFAWNWVCFVYILFARETLANCLVRAVNLRTRLLRVRTRVKIKTKTKHFFVNPGILFFRRFCHFSTKYTEKCKFHFISPFSLASSINVS